MSSGEFKEMCRKLKVFPVVVSEETIDKVMQFCAVNQKNGDDGAAGESGKATLASKDAAGVARGQL